MNNCAPGNNNKDTCFSDRALRILADTFNKSLHSSEKKEKYINLNLDRKSLIKELNTKIKRKCRSCNKSHAEWLQDEFIKKIDDDEIKNLTFRPIGPYQGRQWLSTIDINKVMYQYQNHYQDFHFVGAIPIDFDDLSYLKIKKNHIASFDKKGKKRFGIIFNLDESYKSGSHWTAMFVDLNSHVIFYFDSYGSMPEKRIVRLIRRFKDYIFETKNAKANIYINRVRHQYKNSECGVYSMNFILRLLKGEKFTNIINNKTSDDEVNKCRSYYFRSN